MALELPPGVIPITSLTTPEILYGERTTSWRWEVLAHAAGVDTLVGYLAGVEEGSAALHFTGNQAVKGTGELRIADLSAADTPSGFLRIGALPLASLRLRPVQVIQGLPEIPWGVFLISGAPEAWSGSGRVYGVELLDKATVLEQDAYEQTVSISTTLPIMSAISAVISSAGESVVIDNLTTTLSSPMVFEAGVSKLQIVNELLAALNYTSLWVDGVGNYRLTPYLLPASRPATYELLSIPRELIDGETAIYDQEWSRDRDLYKVPNKVITVQTSTASAPALTGVATNLDAASPFSYANRGNRWITRVITGVDTPAGTDPEVTAFLNAKARASLVAASAVQAQIEIKHLPVPARPSDVFRFANVPAGIDKRHVLTKFDLEAFDLGLMTSSLQEVIDL